MKQLLVIPFLVAACQPRAKAPPAHPEAEHHNPGEMKHDHGHHAHHGHKSHVHQGPVGHRFEKADDWTAQFDDPARDEWQKPDEVIAALALSPGMTVADVGAGTGYFSARLAKSVGPTGKVLAVDIEPDMVRYLGERAKRENTPNVEARLGAPDDPKLGTSTVDRILIVDVWHHVAARGDYAKKIAAAVKPGGSVFVVDFTLDAKRGPPPEHRLSSDAIKADLEGAGLRVSLVEESLPDQYILKASR